MYQVHQDFREYQPVKRKDLDAIIEGKVLDLSGLDNPIIIRKVELLFNNGAYIVRTTSEEGLVGLSVTNEKLEVVWPLLQKLIAPFFIGKDARDLEDILEKVYVYKSNYKMAGVPYYSALSGMELSVLDLLAKAKGIPLGRLFGERIHDSADIYVASGNRETTPEEELEIIRTRVEKTGAKAIKFKIGGRMSKNRDSMEGRSEGMIYGSREFFGKNMIIHADGNGSYDVTEALRYGRMLEEIGAYFYEEPCPFDDLEATRDVTGGTRIPLAFGEQENSLSRFRWLVENHGCDVIQPDILYNGGLIRTTKVARMADLARMTITPHVSSGFCFVYILHLSSYTPNIGKYQESKTGLEMTNEFLEGQIVLKDGTYNIPDSVGIGICEDNPIIRKALCIFDVH